MLEKNPVFPKPDGARYIYERHRPLTILLIREEVFVRKFLASGKLAATTLQ